MLFINICDKVYQVLEKLWQSVKNKKKSFSQLKFSLMLKNKSYSLCMMYINGIFQKNKYHTFRNQRYTKKDKHLKLCYLSNLLFYKN
jgi:hypothetical protein